MTHILAVLADDIAAYDVDDITVLINPYSGLSTADFDELKTIMAERNPEIRLQMIEATAANWQPVRYPDDVRGG
jgi:hypothetical protein